MLLKHLNVLNIALAAAIALFASYILIPFMHIKVELKPLTGLKKELVNTPVKDTTPSQPPFADFSIISANNIFHPERKMPPANEAVNQPKPEFILYGTLVAGSTRIAYMEDKKNPYSTRGRGQRQRKLTENESLSGYTVETIETDRVVMKQGEERIVVMVSDPHNQKVRASEGVAPKAAKTPASK